MTLFEVFAHDRKLSILDFSLALKHNVVRTVRVLVKKHFVDHAGGGPHLSNRV